MVAMSPVRDFLGAATGVGAAVLGRPPVIEAVSESGGSVPVRTSATFSPCESCFSIVRLSRFSMGGSGTASR